MHKRNIERAQHSVHAIHELIHGVFTDRGGKGRHLLEPLMEHFAEDFSMVTTHGQIVGRAQVEQLFRSAVGARPGLQILISDLQLIHVEASCVILRYRETHSRDGEHTARWSSVLMRVTQDSQQWLSLHETACETTAQ